MFKRITVFLISLSLVLGFAYWAGDALRPRRSDFGAVWESYLEEPENSIDILIFGSSTAYCNFIPAVIYEQTGLTSFVMAGPEQTMPMTWYYVQEALKTQSPQKIVVEISGLYFEEYTGFTRINTGYMPWGLNRLGATFFASEQEEWLGLLFPIYNYHSRWAQWETYAPEPDPLAGYTYLTDSNPVEFALRNAGASEEVYQRNLEYLSRIVGLAKKRGIELELCLAPASSQFPEDLLTRLRQDVAALGCGELVDHNSHVDEMGIDLSQDYYDNLHFNVHGAWKFSRYVAKQWQLTPGGSEDTQLWESRVEYIRQRLEEDGIILE